MGSVLSSATKGNVVNPIASIGKAQIQPISHVPSGGEDAMLFPSGHKCDIDHANPNFGASLSGWKINDSWN